MRLLLTGALTGPARQHRHNRTAIDIFHPPDILAHPRFPPWTAAGSDPAPRNRERGRSHCAFDLAALRATPLTREPFEYVIVPGFIKSTARTAINADFPQITKPGSFPASTLSYGPAFQALLDELNGDAMRQTFEEKFDIDLTGRPTMTTVRGRCWEKDGHIHTDCAQQADHGVDLPEPDVGAGRRPAPPAPLGHGYRRRHH